MLFINLDGNATVQVGITVENAAITNNNPIFWLRHHSRKGKFPRFNFDYNMREEYHLTAKDGDIHSQIVLLNGKILAVDSSGNIPRLKPIRVNPLSLVTVAPFSIVFAHIPNILVPACKK